MASSESPNKTVVPIQQTGMKPHYQCNKMECVSELRDHGVMVHKDLTLPEVRVLLRDARRKAGLLPSEGKTEDPMARLKSANLVELKRLASQYGVPYEAKTSVGELRVMIRMHILQSGDSETILHLGKHEGKTFHEIYDNHRTYAEWAQKEVQTSNDPHWRLVQFATWCSHQSDMNEDQPVGETKDEKQDLLTKTTKGKGNKWLLVREVDSPEGGSPSPKDRQSPSKSSEDTAYSQKLEAENAVLKEQLTAMMARLRQLELQVQQSGAVLSTAAGRTRSRS